MIEIKIKVAGETIADAVTELVRAVGEQNDELKALLAAANPAPVPEEDNPEGITLDEVRAVLLTCRDRGVNQAEIVKLFAPDLTSVKKVDYPKLMAAALNALEAKAAEAMSTITEPEQPTAEEETPAEPEQPAADEAKDAEKTYTREEVRAKLAEAKTKGYDIQEIMKPYGTPLRAVDPKDYPKLMADVLKVLGEEEQN